MKVARCVRDARARTAILHQNPRMRLALLMSERLRAGTLGGEREEHRLERAHDQLEPAHRDVRAAQVEHVGVDPALHREPELAGW